MTHHVQVKVVNRFGEPLDNERVSLFATPITDAGPIPDQMTDRRGIAQFDMELEDRAELTVYVRGREYCRRAPARDHYDISV